MAKGLSQRTALADRFIRSPSALVGVVNAYAQLATPHRELMEALSPHVQRHVDSLREQEVACLIWAWARIAPKGGPVPAALGARTRDLLAQGSTARWPQDPSLRWMRKVTSQPPTLFTLSSPKKQIMEKRKVPPEYKDKRLARKQLRPTRLHQHYMPHKAKTTPNIKLHFMVLFP